MNTPNRGLLTLAAVPLVAAVAWLVIAGQAETEPRAGEPATTTDGSTPSGVEAPAEQPSEPERRLVDLPDGADAPALVHVRGRVVDAYGEPLTGALVGDVASDSPVVTPSDGRFELGATRADGAISLLVIAPGHAPSVSRQEVLAIERVHDAGDVEILSGGGVRGVVTDEAGAPLAGVAVTLRLRSSEFWSTALDLGEILTPSTTGSDGRYSFAHVVPGAYRLEMTATGMQSARWSTLTVREGVETEVEPIALAVGFTLTGSVLGPRDEPLAGAVVRLRNGPNQPRFRGQVETAVDGRFAIGALPPGPMRIEVNRPGFLGHRQNDVDAARGEDLIVRLEAGLRVTGTVVDVRSGAPVDRFAVSVRRIGTVDPSSNGTMAQQLERRIAALREAAVSAVDSGVRERQMAIADQLESRLEADRLRAQSRPVAVPGVVGETTAWPDGRFSIDGLEEGVYAVGIASPDHRFAEVAPVELRRGTPPSDLHFELAEGHGLSGVVVFRRNGTPVAGGTVELVSVTESSLAPSPGARSLYPWVFARSGPSGVTVMTTRTDSGGRFEFRQASPGRYFLSARHAAIADHETAILVVPSGRQSIRIEVGARASLRGTVSNLRPGGTGDVAVLILGGHGTMRTVRADADGRYRCAGLQPGSYIVRAYPADSSRYLSRLFGSIFPLHVGAVDPEQIPACDVTLAPGEDGVFDPVCDLPPAGVVQGELSINGQPGEGGRVILRPVPGEAPGSGGLSLRGDCDDLGSFSIVDVPAGEYTVVVTSATRQVLHDESLLVAPSTTSFVAVDVQAGGLRGRVTVPDAAPAEEIRGYLWVLPGASEVPADLYEYRRAQRTHRIRVRNGVFEDASVTTGPAVVVVDLRSRERTSTTVVIPARATLGIDLSGGARER